MPSRKVTRKVSYRIAYAYPWCFDDDSPSGIGDHQVNWTRTGKDIDVRTDREAQLASFGPEFHGSVGCHCSNARAHPTAIIKTVVERTADGFERTTQTKVPLPRSRECACGKVYWPVKGEKACHELKPVAA